MDNIVIVPRKYGRIRVCMYYRNLNKISPNDDFSLLYIDVLVDNAIKNTTYLFMDEFLGYNHIRMAEED